MANLKVIAEDTVVIKNSKISISKADMSKKLTAFRIILFFINHNILSSVYYGDFPRQPRSEHTSRIPPKESMFKVNLFSYSFGA